MSKQQRKSISLSEKVQLIKMREKERITQRHLAERFGIGKTQVSFILSQKAKFLEEYASGCPSKRSTKMSPERKQLDKMCVEWVKDMRSRNESFTGPLLRQKAREFARKLNIKNFCGSEGWLHRFRRRHELNAKPGTAQAAAANGKKECVSVENDDDDVENVDDDDDDGDDEEDRKPNLSEVLSGFNNLAGAATKDDNSFFFEVPKDTTTAVKSEKPSRTSAEPWQSVPKEIHTTGDALKYINNLKLFLKYDYAALHLAKNLESVLQHKLSTEK